jgi:CheY-like chemotaxis protein
MEHGACNVIYIDRRANDEHVRRESLSNSLAARTTTGSVAQGYFGFAKTPPPEIHANVEAILSTFNEGKLHPRPLSTTLQQLTLPTVHICKSGGACLEKIAQLQDSSNRSVPTIVLIDIACDEERNRRLSRDPYTPSPSNSRITRTDISDPDDIYGMHLLMHISSEIQSKNFSKLVIPVVILSGSDRDWALNTLPVPNVHGSQVLTDTVRLVRYLDAGAVDVLSSPLSRDSAHGLAVHAYRVHKEVSREESGFLAAKKNRKLSWVGVNEAKPYAYLREAMVSTLMSGICNPETVGDSLDATYGDPEPPNELVSNSSRGISVDQDRRAFVAQAIGTWSFSAHDFTDDELVYCCLLMLKHALRMPELERWNMADGKAFPAYPC